ncbi:MAG: FeoB-associated Cys-rich membrane protein [Schwartzia sp.]|nr:FeoB-associated Cys-rich membrane protein [Schwartzia sp. (in: firmicutes)]
MATFVLGAGIAALVALALRHAWRERAAGHSCWAAGSGGCGGACGGCGQCRKG